MDNPKKDLLTRFTEVLKNNSSFIKEDQVDEDLKELVRKVNRMRDEYENN